jgi:hypothetical protein
VPCLIGKFSVDCWPFTFHIVPVGLASCPTSLAVTSHFLHVCEDCILNLKFLVCKEVIVQEFK